MDGVVIPPQVSQQRSSDPPSLPSPASNVSAPLTAENVQNIVMQGLTQLWNAQRKVELDQYAVLQEHKRQRREEKQRRKAEKKEEKQRAREEKEARRRAEEEARRREEERERERDRSQQQRQQEQWGRTPGRQDPYPRYDPYPQTGEFNSQYTTQTTHQINNNNPQSAYHLPFTHDLHNREERWGEMMKENEGERW
jgi:hypothetical protein